MDEAMAVEIEAAHGILDKCFTAFPADPCAGCREHSVGFRLARLDELHEAENTRLHGELDAVKGFASEILHWVYPMEGHGQHRANQFVIEAMIGYILLAEPHPFHNSKGIEAEAKAILARAARKRGEQGKGKL